MPNRWGGLESLIQVMICLKQGWRPAVVLGFILVAASVAWAQDTTTVSGTKPAGEVIGDTGAPYSDLFRPLHVGGSPFQPKIGPGQGTISVPILSAPTYHIPLIRRGFQPENAELKIGRFYVDIRELSSSFLFSDNVNATETGRKNGYIGIVRLDLALLFQVNDGLQLAVAGALVYLPFQNKFGVAGFGITDPLNVNFNVGPLAHAQIVYDFLLAGWDIRLYDDFRVTTPQYEAGLTLDQQFQGASFTNVDVAGRYVYGDSTSRGTRGDNRFRNGRLTEQDLEYHNLAGFSGSKLLPTVTRARFSYEHENIWYTGNNPSAYNTRDTGRASLVSERENLRFKPFIYYETTTDNLRKGWDHQLRAGVFGPVTENLDFLGDGGYYWSDDSKANTAVWRLLLGHTPGPLTYQSVEYGRTITQPDRNVVDYAAYHLTHILGRDLTGEILGEWRRYENLRINNSGTTEYRAGARLSYLISPRTDFRATGLYTKRTTDAALGAASDIFTGQLLFTRHHSATLRTELFYQYEQRDSSQAGDSYYENLVVLSIHKTF